MSLENLKNTITAEAVDNAVAAFKASITNSKLIAQEAAVAVLLHCYQHRNADRIRNMLEVIETEGKGFVRRAPFTLWLRQFAPVKMATVKLGDKEVRRLEFDKESPLLANADQTIADAVGKLWWTMSQEKEVGAFDLVAFDKRILGIAKKALAQLDELGDVDKAVHAHVSAIFTQFSKFVAADQAAVAKLATAGRKAA
jgi:hypothetical protein